MNLVQEYKKQNIYVLLGMIFFIFPFFSKYQFMLPGLFLIAAVILLFIPPTSTIFNLLARESDTKSGRLITLIQLFSTTAAILTISSIFGDEKFPIFITGSALAISTFGDGVADLINILDKEKKKIAKTDHREIKVYSAKSSLIFLISGSICAFIAGLWITSFSSYVPINLLVFLSVMGALAGALLESMTINEDNIIIPFGSAMVMWLFYTFGYNVDTKNLIEVLAFSFLLGYLSYRARIADISAMLSATLLGVVIIISTDIDWFFTLLAFFILGSLFTRYKYSYKIKQGTAERKGGIRGYKNVFSNSLAALSLAISYSIFPDHRALLMAGYLGSVATACGDTLASEIGQTYKGNPRMITTFKRVKPGTDGAVSLLGEGASILGAIAIAMLAYVLIQKDAVMAFSVIAGGFIGTNIDSAFGATLQQKGYLTNNGVNLIATISGAAVSILIYKYTI